MEVQGRSPTPDDINAGAIRDVRLQRPIAQPAVLSFVPLPGVSQPGPPRLELAVGGDPLELALGPAVQPTKSIR